MTIPVVDQVMALTWALETGEPHRFRAVRKAVSYCGLCVNSVLERFENRDSSIKQILSP